MATLTSNFHSTNDRLIVSKSDAETGGILNRLSDAWTRYRSYRTTLLELRELPDAVLRDLNFDRGDLAQIAHREVYGQ